MASVLMYRKHHQDYIFLKKYIWFFINHSRHFFINASIYKQKKMTGLLNVFASLVEIIIFCFERSLTTRKYVVKMIKIWVVCLTQLLNRFMYLPKMQRRFRQIHIHHISLYDSDCILMKHETAHRVVMPTTNMYSKIIHLVM